MRNNLGFSVLTLLVAIGLLGSLAILSMQGVKLVTSLYKKSEIRAARLDLSHYVEENHSCQNTFSEPGFICGTTSALDVNFYNKSGEILCNQDGSSKIGIFFCSAKCQNGNKLLVYFRSKSENDWMDLFEGIPISCPLESEISEIEEETDIMLGIAFEDSNDFDYNDSIFCFEGKFRFNQSGEVISLVDQTIDVLVKRNAYYNQAIRVSIDGTSIFQITDLADGEQRSINSVEFKAGERLMVEFAASNGVSSSLMSGNDSVLLEKDTCRTDGS